MEIEFNDLQSDKKTRWSTTWILSYDLQTDQMDLVSTWNLTLGPDMVLTILKTGSFSCSYAPVAIWLAILLNTALWADSILSLLTLASQHRQTSVIGQNLVKWPVDVLYWCQKINVQGQNGWQTWYNAYSWLFIVAGIISGWDYW